MAPKPGCLTTLLLFLLLTVLSCSGGGDFVDPRLLQATEISGTYRSDSTVGVLGVLRLELARVEQSRVYAARLSGDDPEAFGSADGIGTLADGHLVLHFDRGEEFDYFFEGDVLGAEGASSISGEFIFPDQSDMLPVSFSPQQ
ncbi:hypothetical protein KDL44_02325 [bacterium]|nr:hypothetical protein [bacterium]